MADPITKSKSSLVEPIDPMVPQPSVLVYQDFSKQMASASVDDTSDDYVNETFPLISHWRDSFSLKVERSNEFCVVMSVLVTLAALIILFIICIIVIILFVLLKRR